MTYTLYRADVTEPILRRGYDDLDELMGFLPVYEDHGIPVVIRDSNGLLVYETEGAA